LSGKISARLRDCKGLGEVDIPVSHTRVYLPTLNGGYELRYVKIVSGDQHAGSGIVDDKPRHSKFGLGTQITYAGGTDSGVKPKMVRKQHRANKKRALLDDVAKELANQMQLKPSAYRLPAKTKRYVSAATIEKFTSK